MTQRPSSDTRTTTTRTTTRKNLPDPRAPGFRTKKFVINTNKSVADNTRRDDGLVIIIIIFLRPTISLHVKPINSPRSPSFAHYPPAARKGFHTPDQHFPTGSFTKTSRNLRAHVAGRLASPYNNNNNNNNNATNTRGYIINIVRRQCACVHESRDLFGPTLTLLVATRAARGPDRTVIRREN